MQGGQPQSWSSSSVSDAGKSVSFQHRLVPPAKQSVKLCDMEGKCLYNVGALKRAGSHEMKEWVNSSHIKPVLKEHIRAHKKTQQSFSLLFESLNLCSHQGGYIQPKNNSAVSLEMQRYDSWNEHSVISMI